MVKDKEAVIQTFPYVSWCTATNSHLPRSLDIVTLSLLCIYDGGAQQERTETQKQLHR